MKKPLIVFTYAPAGLGHIRVANALIGGIPKDLPYVEFSPADNTTESMHRFSSLNVPARHVMEFFQRGAPESLFTKFYVKHLKKHTEDVSAQFVNLIKKQKERPEKVIIVATHFGLAHQLGFVKKDLEKVLDTQIFLVVQITDDSPQVAWYVDTADLIICPSKYTKESLHRFAVTNQMRRIETEVAPYPVDLDFAKALTKDKVAKRRFQFDPDRNSPIDIVIPVSGAAVGMEFFLHVMTRLHKKSSRFVFHVVCRKAPFTQSFISKVNHRAYVKLYTSAHYKTVVDMYKRVYMENVIAAEITKPSEQAFKALLSAESIGGSFLLLAEPVGRQEHDNMDFLQRHGFLPKGPGESSKPNNLRGCVLPFGSKASAEVIWDLFKNKKLLGAFDNFVAKDSNDETGDDGVVRFWDVVSTYFGRT